MKGSAYKLVFVGAARRGVRRGQVWSLDFTLGFLLFLLTLLLVLSVLARNLLTDDTFDELLESSDALSSKLLGTGYPSDWRDDVISIGLLTNDALSMRKAERFASLAAEEYDRTKSLLDTPYDYSVIFYEPNGTILPVGTACAIGSDKMSEQKTTSMERKRILYYHGSNPGQNQLEATVIALNGSVETDPEAFFDRLATGKDEIAILEEPQLSDTLPPYNKASLLESFVENGGTLLLIGNVTLPVFNLDLTFHEDTPRATGNHADQLLNFSNTTLQDLGAAFTIAESGQRRFESLASFNDSAILAAHFTFGDGDVFYLGTLDGVVNETGETVLERVAAGINQTSRLVVAHCQAVTPPKSNQYVTVRRLVAYRGRVLLMRLDLWT